LEPYFPSIMQIILTRLQNSKTETLTLRFVRLFHFISAHDDKGYSADFVIQVIDKVQAEYAPQPLGQRANKLTTPASSPQST
jgi:exportin-2 (importin alpha re-exporter)